MVKRVIRPLPRKVVVRKTYSSISYGAILVLSILGTLFAGYLSFEKFFSNVCVLSEGCSELFGIPTCLYGFVLFFILTMLSLVSFLSDSKFSKGINLIAIIGFLFSLYFSVYELFFAPINILNGANYSLILPSCVYGMILYIVIALKSK